MADKDKPTSTKNNAKEESSQTDTEVHSLECAVCLQTCVHPVQLNCDHIFCFLCVKGVTTHSKRCPMCRREISPGCLEKPNLVQPDLERIAQENESMQDERYSWFYAGRNGWWKYEERAAAELEEAYRRTIDTDGEQAETVIDGNNKCELLIAGFLYVIDFEHMIQYRRNEPHRQRKIKREKLQSVADCKGVAGLRIETNTSDEQDASNRSTNPLTSTSNSDTSFSREHQDAGILVQEYVSENSTNSVQSNSISVSDSQPETSEIDTLLDNVTRQLTNVGIHQSNDSNSDHGRENDQRN